MIGKYAMVLEWTHNLYEFQWQHLTETTAELFCAKRRETHALLGECYVGFFLFGVGMFDVYVPVTALRCCTDAERAYYTRPNRVAYTFTDKRSTLQKEDFAITLADLPAPHVVAAAEGASMKTKTIAQCEKCDKPLIATDDGFILEGKLHPALPLIESKPLLAAPKAKAWCRRCFLTALGIREIATR